MLCFLDVTFVYRLQFWECRFAFYFYHSLQPATDMFHIWHIEGSISMAASQSSLVSSHNQSFITLFVNMTMMGHSAYQLKARLHANVFHISLPNRRSHLPLDHMKSRSSGFVQLCFIQLLHHIALFCNVFNVSWCLCVM